MENKPKEQIAIALFTGAIIAFFIQLNDLIENLLFKISILFLLIILIIISLKVLLDPSTDLHFIGNIIRKFLNIK